jgi:hypothetical protein
LAGSTYRSGLPMNLRTALLSAASAALATSFACSKPNEGTTSPVVPPATAPATSGTAGTPAATTTATASASATVPTGKEPPVYGLHKVPAGFTGDGLWSDKFEIVRDRGNTGLSWDDAMAKCTATGKSLCTDSQWARACEADKELSSIETWTATGVGGEKYVVRGGGEAGCRSRDVMSASEKKGDRAAVCCDRTVVIKTGNKNEAFLKSSAKRLLDYETAIRSHDGLSLGALYDEKITFMGKEASNPDLIKLHDKDFKIAKDQWPLFDVCDVNVDKVSTDKGPDVKLGANCRTLFHRNGHTYVAMQRIVWGGPGMKIQLLGDPVTARSQAADGTFIEEKEVKERVGMLLVAD